MFSHTSPFCVRLKMTLLYTYKCIYLLNPSARGGSVFERTFTGLNKCFSFSRMCCDINFKEPSLSYYLFIIRCIPFRRVLMLWEMQTAYSKIWYWVTMSISCNGNSLHYEPFTLTHTHTHTYIYICVCVCVCVCLCVCVCVLAQIKNLHNDNWYNRLFHQMSYFLRWVF